MHNRVLEQQGGKAVERNAHDTPAHGAEVSAKIGEGWGDAPLADVKQAPRKSTQWEAKSRSHCI